MKLPMDSVLSWELGLGQEEGGWENGKLKYESYLRFLACWINYLSKGLIACVCTLIHTLELHTLGNVHNTV